MAKVVVAKAKVVGVARVTKMVVPKSLLKKLVAKRMTRLNHSWSLTEKMKVGGGKKMMAKSLRMAKVVVAKRLRMAKVVVARVTKMVVPKSLLLIKLMAKRNHSWSLTEKMKVGGGKKMMAKSLRMAKVVVVKAKVM